MNRILPQELSVTQVRIILSKLKLSTGSQTMGLPNREIHYFSHDSVVRSSNLNVFITGYHTVDN